VKNNPTKYLIDFITKILQKLYTKTYNIENKVVKTAKNKRK